MSQVTWLSQVRQQKVIAVIRAADLEVGFQMAKAIAAGGIQMIEITWNGGAPSQLVKRLTLELPDCTIGAGTLLTVAQMQEAIDAGATFLFTPHTNADLMQAALQASIPVIPGALSPTEIVTAWQAGATCVKVFPIASVGGTDYIRHLQAPLGQIPLIPTGGITIANARSFIEAGAIAVGLGGQLFPKQALAEERWEWITDRAADLMQKIHSST